MSHDATGWDMHDDPATMVFLRAAGCPRPWRRSRQRGHEPGRECAVNGARVPELAGYDVVLVNISGG